VTITATRGIVSGFERADFGRLIKTDAEITRGNSGGAAIDERGLLIGVPSSTVENGSGQIGYVHPIDALPPSWRARIAR
jgi:S1-C subfamily serine protease